MVEQYKNKKVLQKLYYDKEMSMSEIGNKFNVSQQTIMYYMDKYDIKRRSLSEALKGENAPMYGKTHSEETKKKMSESHKGVNHHQYGKKLPQEVKQKISESMKGEKNPMYGKLGKDAPWYNKSHSEETKKKMSESHKGVNHHFYGKNLSKKHKNKISESMKGKTCSEETKQKISKALSGENAPWYGKSGKDNPHWKPDSNNYEIWRERTLSSNKYQKVRKKVLKRDNYKCQLCDNNMKLEVHHIIPMRKLWDIDNKKLVTDINNLITLCKKCHQSIKGREKEYKKIFKEIVK